MTTCEEILEKIEAVVTGKVEIRAGCSKCHNGIIYMAEGEDRLIDSRSTTCECARKVEHIRECVALFKAANYPSHVFKKYDFRKYKETQLTKEHLLKFVQTDSLTNWAYLYGNVGTGKTFAACLAGLYAISLGKSVLYVNAPVLLDKLRPNSEDADSSRRWKEMCNSVDLLILDDIGQEKSSDWVKEQFYIVVQGRYHSDKHTILTSNYSLDELETYGLQKQLVSRISHKSIIKQFDGPDERKSDL